MASEASGSLQFRDSDTELTFEATLSPEVQESSWVKDFLAGFASGLVLGLSPGFRFPPQQTVPNAYEVEEEDPAEGRALIRYVNEAILTEVSAVTRGAYPEAEIEARHWETTPTARVFVPRRNRWRL